MVLLADPKNHIPQALYELSGYALKKRKGRVIRRVGWFIYENMKKFSIDLFEDLKKPTVAQLHDAEAINAGSRVLLLDYLIAQHGKELEGIIMPKYKRLRKLY